MTRRARRRRRIRQRRQRRARARRRGHSSHYSEPVDCSCFDQMNDNAPSSSRSIRAFFVGGTACTAIGIVCLFSEDATGGFKIIVGAVSFCAGVVMLACLIRALARYKKEGVVYRGGLTGVTVEQPGSSHLLPPSVPPHSPRALPPPRVPPHSTEFLHPPRIPPHATELVQLPRVPSRGTGMFLPLAGTAQSQVGQVFGYYPGGGPQETGDLPTLIWQTSRNPSPVSWRTSRNPSPAGGRTSRNPSPFIGRPLPDPPSDRSRPTVEGGDPPPYTSVVSAKPWEDPPSYQEASSCLVPRVDTDGSPAPSAPDISIVVEQYSSTSPSASADPVGSPSDSNPNESEHPPSAPLLP
ncbi:uncharacterized protein [Macrobrachium rosenbergii]|uniref:uncharacterized protein isoform X2 n=2 Tax=Macrobrachium rosenbergii TaxID=79674 RepID=UPI0034D5D41F